MTNSRDRRNVEHLRGPDEHHDDRLAEEAHARLRHPWGDHFTDLAVFDAWAAAGSSQRWCEEHYLSFKALSAARRIK